MAEWAEHLGKMGGNMKIKLNPTQVRVVAVHPVEAKLQVTTIEPPNKTLVADLIITERRVLKLSQEAILTSHTSKIGCISGLNPIGQRIRWNLETLARLSLTAQRFKLSFPP